LPDHPETVDRRSLRRTLRALCAVLALLVGWAHAAEGPLSFADALRAAEAAPGARLAARALELADRQLAVTGAWLRGEASAGYRWTRGERDLGAAGTSDLDEQGYDPIALTLSSPALASGIGPTADALARAEADRQRAETDLAGAVRAARIEIAGAFHNALRARTELELAEAELRLAGLELEAARLRQAAGAAGETELDRLRLAFERGRTQRDTAARELELADAALELALGGAAGTPVGPLPHPEALLGAATPQWGRRGDVLAAAQQVADTDRVADATLRDALPSVSLSVAGAFADAERSLQASAGFDTRSFLPSVALSFDPDSGGVGLADDGRSRSVTVAVGVRVPLDTSVGNALAAARTARARAQEQLDLALARAQLEAAQRRHDLDVALANADLARTAAALAADDLTVAEARFAGGGISALALERARLDAARAALDAERALDTARVAALRWLDAAAAEPAPWE